MVAGGPVPRNINWFERNTTTLKTDSLTLGLAQIDDALLRLSTMLKKAERIKNSIAPINNLPTETVELIATFFAKERDLVNATATCQRWRTMLLFCPRLWCNAGGSPSELQAYIERSGSMPITVSLSSPELAKFIVPHTSRLVGLAVRANNLDSSFSEIGEHLQHPIPTLHTFRIFTGTSRLHTVEFPSGARDTFFIHSKKLVLEGISLFRGTPLLFKFFPHVTDLTLRTDEHTPIRATSLVDMLEHFPMLERVSLAFGSDWDHGPHPRTIKLPFVQEIRISSQGVYIPPILTFTILPKLASLHVQIPPPIPGIAHTIFPAGRFGDYLPNLTYLPELQIGMAATAVEAVFRNPQVMFRYVTTGKFRTYHQDQVAWGALPLLSVRGLIVDIRESQGDVDYKWLTGLLQDLACLEHLEFGGECNDILRHLCHGMVREGLRPRIQTLIARAAEEYETRSAHPQMRQEPTRPGYGRNLRLGLWRAGRELLGCVRGWFERRLR